MSIEEVNPIKKRPTGLLEFLLIILVVLTFITFFGVVVF
jgi:hypothetical protein